MESRGVVCRALVMVERLKLGWWQVADGAVQTPVIPPIDPRCSSQLHLLERAPWTSCTDHLSFVEAVDGLRQHVVIAVPT